MSKHFIIILALNVILCCNYNLWQLNLRSHQLLTWESFFIFSIAIVVIALHCFNSSPFLLLLFLMLSVCTSSSYHLCPLSALSNHRCSLALSCTTCRSLIWLNSLWRSTKRHQCIQCAHVSLLNVELEMTNCDGLDLF
eukprot:529668_1